MLSNDSHKISVFQIYFDEHSFKFIGDGFLPYFNSNKDNLFENSVILDVPPSDYIGVTSWRLTEKTGYKSKDLLSEIDGKYDVYIYSPHTYFFNGDATALKNFDSFDFWERNKVANSSVYQLASLLNDAKVLPFNIFDGWVFCLFNYWIARKEVFIDYRDNVLKPAIDFLKSVDLTKFTCMYKGKSITPESFVLEGLFGSFLYNKKASYNHISSSIYSPTKCIMLDDGSIKIKSSGELFDLKLSEEGSIVVDSKSDNVKNINLSSVLSVEDNKLVALVGDQKVELSIVDNKLAAHSERMLKQVNHKRIVGFWHVCMINDYLDVVKEQLAIIIDSKLYDKVRYIFMCCVGDDVELIKLKELIKSHSKIKLINYETSLASYEFETLKKIRVKAKEDSFFCFYIHTKGVSYPNHPAGKHWRVLIKVNLKNTYFV